MRGSVPARSEGADSLTLQEAIQASYDGIAIFNGRGSLLHSGGATLAKVAPTDWAEAQVICKEAIRRRQPVSALKSGLDGRENFLLTACPVFDGKGTVSHVVCNVRDLDDLNSLGHDENQIAPANRIALLLEEEPGAAELLGEFITRSVTMQRVLATAARVARVDSTILILGESGVGKGLLARLIQRISRRKAEPFVKIACGAIPEQLLESELFGYEPGAFTGAQKRGKPGLFEVAGNGTVFLDEVAELPLSLQVKLLNVLQDRTFHRIGGIREINVNARVIAATNKNLDQQVKSGLFRSDLYYRLHVVPITIPPLCERRGDILPLANHFLNIFNERYGFDQTLSPDVVNCLVKHQWPGNVRELQNAIEYLVVMAQHDKIHMRHLPQNITGRSYESGFDDDHFARSTLKDAMEDFERDVIERMLTTHETMKDAADSLGIDISTLTRKKQKYGLTRSRAVHDTDQEVRELEDA